MRTLQHCEFLAQRRFGALDGLRGIAAAMVIAFHFGGPALSFLNGWLGVQLFFVLSGFLITTLALREEDRSGRISFTGFYLRRFFRIVPVYLAVVLLVLTLDVLNRGWSQSLGPNLLWYLTFNVEWLEGSPALGQAWTLGIENKFYLVWPLLAFGGGALLVQRRLLRIALIMTGLAGLLLVTTDAVYYAEILMGCTVAVLMHSPKTFPLVRPLAAPLAGAIVAVAAIVVMLLTPQLTAATGSIFLASALFALAVALLIPSMLRPSAVVRVLSSRPMAWVGDRSYALYLVQYPAASIAVALAPGWFSTPRIVTFLAVTLVGLAIADLLSKWVEQPGISLGRRVLAVRAERRAEQDLRQRAHVPAPGRHPHPPTAPLPAQPQPVPVG